MYRIATQNGVRRAPCSYFTSSSRSRRNLHPPPSLAARYSLKPYLREPTQHSTGLELGAAAHSRLVTPWSSSSAARRANLRLYDRALGCCRAEAGARLALSSGGGAATLRLVSLRLPCSEGKGDDGRRGAGTEWLRRWGGGGAEVGRRGVGRGGRTLPCCEESGGAGVGVVRDRCGAGVGTGAALGATRQDAARCGTRMEGI